MQRDRDPVIFEGETSAAGGEPGVGGGLVRLLIFAVLIALAFFIAGFLQFACEVAELSPTVTTEADGIVVLTGGRARIHSALDLLRKGRGKRLLITGVFPGTRPEDLTRPRDAAADLFACCVDLGFEAETTIGNAAEAALWARARGFSSLIVVTGAYHMPRALVEFSAAMPSVQLVPYPVRPADLELDRWYQNADTLRLLGIEYTKFVLARLRVLLLGAEV